MVELCALSFKTFFFFSWNELAPTFFSRLTFKTALEPNSRSNDHYTLACNLMCVLSHINWSWFSATICDRDIFVQFFSNFTWRMHHALNQSNPKDLRLRKTSSKLHFQTLDKFEKTCVNNITESSELNLNVINSFLSKS